MCSTFLSLLMFNPIFYINIFLVILNLIYIYYIDILNCILEEGIFFWVTRLENTLYIVFDFYIGYCLFIFLLSFPLSILFYRLYDPLSVPSNNLKLIEESTKTIIFFLATFIFYNDDQYFTLSFICFVVLVSETFGMHYFFTSIDNW